MEYLSKTISDTQNEVKDVNSKVQNLPDQIIVKFDEKYALKEHTQNQLNEIKETIEPLTSLRKHIFTALVVIVVVGAAVVAAAYTFVMNNGIAH